MPEYNNPTAAPPAPVEGGNPTEEEDPAQSLINDLLDASPETLATLHALFDVALAVRAPPAPSPPLPPPPVPPPTPPPPPPPPSFLLTLLTDPDFAPRLSGTDSPFPLHALVRLAQCSKDYRVALQTVA